MKIPTQEQTAYMVAHKDETRQPEIYAVCVVCLTFTLAMVALRFISRHIGKVALKMDDWFMVGAWVFMAIFAISYCVSTLYGMGKHAILATQPRSLIVTFTLASCAYMISILCVKLSLLALYRRIFPTRWVQITCLAVGSVVVAYTIAQGLSTIFQCIPFDSLWDQSISARCINLNLQPLIMGIINVVTDVVIYAIPMGPIWKLNLPTARKWQLSGLFLVGGLVWVFSILRLFYVNRFASYDATWDNVNLFTLSLLENAAAIVAACLPACRPLVARVRERSRKSSSPITNRPSGKNNPILGGIRKPRGSPRVEDDEERLYTRVEGATSNR